MSPAQGKGVIELAALEVSLGGLHRLGQRGRANHKDEGCIPCVDGRLWRDKRPSIDRDIPSSLHKSARFSRGAA